MVNNSGFELNTATKLMSAWLFGERDIVNYSNESYEESYESYEENSLRAEKCSDWK